MWPHKVTLGRGTAVGQPQPGWLPCPAAQALPEILGRLKNSLFPCLQASPPPANMLEESRIHVKAIQLSLLQGPSLVAQRLPGL